MRSLISPDRLWILPIKGKEGNSLWFFSFFLSFLHVLFKSHLAESACIAAFTSPLSSLFFLKEVLLALYETINHNTACTERKLGFFFHRGFPSTGCWHHYYTGSHCVCSYSAQRLDSTNVIHIPISKQSYLQLPVYKWCINDEAVAWFSGLCDSQWGFWD